MNPKGLDPSYDHDIEGWAIVGQHIKKYESSQPVKQYNHLEMWPLFTDTLSLQI